MYFEYCQAYPIKQLQLTPIAVKFPFNASTKVVRAELVANKVYIKYFNPYKHNSEKFKVNTISMY